MSANITISIPVELGGYTGQRDQWEQHAQDYKVTVEGDVITLQSSGSFSRRIRFSRADLDEAVGLVTR